MIRARVNAGLKRAKDEIKRKGHFVTKHGDVWGFMLGIPVGFAVSELGTWLWRTLPWI
jgi:hypothetical protein